MLFADPLSSVHLNLIIGPVVPSSVLLIRYLAVLKCADVGSQVSENVASGHPLKSVRTQIINELTSIPYDFA